MLANPTVTGILSLECCSTPAAGEYVKRNDLKDKVTVVGFDLLPQTLATGQGRRHRRHHRPGAETPGRDGRQAALVDIINGKPAQSVDTGAEVVDATNIDKYMPK